MMPRHADDETLVAYLDGETSHEQRVELEQRLQSDEPLRKRLQWLSSSWQMLGELPDPAPRIDVVHSTLEMLALEISASELPLHPPTHAEDQPRGPRFTGARWRWAVAIMASMLAIVAGAAIGRAIATQRSNDAMRRLYLAQHLDAFLIAPKIDFIRQLAARDDWKQMVAAMPPGPAQKLERIDLQDVDEKQFRSISATWTDSERAILATRMERVETLPPDAMDRVNRTAEKLQPQAERIKLITQMHVYARWREGLPDELGQRVDELERLDSTSIQSTLNVSTGNPVDDPIGDAISWSMGALSKRSVQWLADDATRRIATTLNDLIQTRLDFGDPEVQSVYRTFARQHPPAAALDAMIRHLMLGDADRQPLELRDDELSMIDAALPAEASQQLTRLTGNDWTATAVVLQLWTEEAVRRGATRKDNRDLKTRYLELPAAARQRLDLLPPGEFYRDVLSPAAGMDQTSP